MLTPYFYYSRYYRAISSLKIDMEEKEVRSVFTALCRPLDKRGSDIEVLEIDAFIQSVMKLQTQKSVKSTFENIQVSPINRSSSINCSYIVYVLNVIYTVHIYYK
jgi:hypothetical protein